LILQLGIVVGFVLRQRWAMIFGLFGYAAWFALQLDSWWRPYFFGGRIVGPNWYFAPIDGRPTPDAAHMVLHVTLLIVLLTGAWALWTDERAKNTSRP
jgi:hypothetical protein